MIEDKLVNMIFWSPLIIIIFYIFFFIIIPNFRIIKYNDENTKERRSFEDWLNDIL